MTVTQLEPAHDKSELIFKMDCEVAKVSEELGLVFGFGMVCKIDGEVYFDLQDDHIPESTMLEAALGFMQSGAVAKDAHSDVTDGSYPFCFPLTAEIAKALGITTSKTGLLVGYKPDTKEMLKRYRTGEYTGFSIGGVILESELVDVQEAA